MAWLYRQRNAVERFFNRLKHFSAVATRYDKRDDNFLASEKLASLRNWLKSYESVTWCGRDADLYPELARLVRLALANALHFWRVERIDLAAPGPYCECGPGLSCLTENWVMLMIHLCLSKLLECCAYFV